MPEDGTLSDIQWSISDDRAFILDESFLRKYFVDLLNKRVTMENVLERSKARISPGVATLIEGDYADNIVTNRARTTIPFYELGNFLGTEKNKVFQLRDAGTHLWFKDKRMML